MSATIIPFRQPETAPRELLAFAVGARVDLRVGAVASGVVRPRGVLEEIFEYTILARLLRAARLTWRERGATAPLGLALPGTLYGDLDAEMLSEAAIEAGCTRRSLTFEICERAILDLGVALAEGLRTRGWGVSLRGDPACPLPFGERARALYTELVLEAPEALDPYLGVDGDRTPLARRLLAAKEAGLVITAETVRTPQQAKMLALAGFDRGGGPFAEATMRSV